MRRRCRLGGAGQATCVAATSAQAGMPHAQLEARGLARTPPRRPQYVGPVITGSARIAAARRRMSGSCVSNLS
jgi:hypothetical protein